VAFRNSGADRCYVAEYTQAVTNTWEFTSITVTASPSAGTWDYTNGAGIAIAFSAACGATFQTTANAWNVGNFFATANQVNGVDNNANFFKLALVQIMPGSQAQPFQLRTEAEELALCQRYYCKSFAVGTAPAQNVGATTGEQNFPATTVGALQTNSNSTVFPVRMRAAPTVVTFNPAAANAQIRDIGAAGDFTGTGAYNLSARSMMLYGTGNAGTAISNICAVHYTASAALV
jgi:hypothetical protein